MSKTDIIKSITMAQMTMMNNIQKSDSTQTMSFL